ncbi:MAG: hypothetical protein ACJZ49_06210 [Candidatus Thalassarchaeaceae archaeon]|nr:MAG: hypothetical protein CMA04_001810 [Euryarchaeota archaeon]RPG74135.1 MAG: hypothetical protein CBC45_005765 [Euryarchaeota archaeon TMED85]
MHGLESRNPLEGEFYGISIGGRVLARRGKGGRRRAPPRPRPQPTNPTPGLTPPPTAENPQESIAPTLSQSTPVAPVQKQYGDIVPSEPVEPEVVEEASEEVSEEVESPSAEIVEDVAIAAPEETSIQDGAERKSLGLTTIETNAEEQVVEVQSDEDRTSNLLKGAQEFARAQGYAQISSQTPKPEPAEVKKERVPRRISKAKKNNQRVEQRATRARRLNRSRHVEYRYEMRSLLKEIEVSPEHHSVLLGSIWAKGERQDANAAKEFVRERVTSGAITEEQCDRLISVIDSYTTRR